MERSKEILLYKTKDGKTSLEVNIQDDTVWLTQAQMVELFQKTKQNISLHINNVFKEKELCEKSVVKESLTTALDGKKYRTKYYNLDVVISVGYRVKSKRGTQFRIWATSTLKKHLIDGFTINEKRLKLEQQKYQELQRSLKLLNNVITLDNVSDETKGFIKIISEYSRALDILDNFDHQDLSVPKGIKRLRYELTYDDARNIIEGMKKKFKDSDLVGQEKDKSFKSSIFSIYQTFEGKDVYPTIQEKAAHLLYFVTKNHSFVDGNKRIAAAIFICFLQRNSILLRKDGSQRIDNASLVALTIMIASSKPAEKDTMIKVVLNLLV